MHIRYAALILSALLVAPSWGSDQYTLLNLAIDRASSDSEDRRYLHEMSVLESSKKVRKYQPQVRQNMDYLGTHNVCLFAQLRREGLIWDAKTWQTSAQWQAWRQLFQERPDIGTLYAARHFLHLKRKVGRDRAVELWKAGKSGTVPGLLYLMRVQTGRFPE